MDTSSIPWESVASFLSARDTTCLRVAAGRFNNASLFGEFGPLLFFLMKVSLNPKAVPVSHTDFNGTGGAAVQASLDYARSACCACLRVATVSVGAMGRC